MSNRIRMEMYLIKIGPLSKINNKNQRIKRSGEYIMKRIKKNSKEVIFGYIVMIVVFFLLHDAKYIFKNNNKTNDNNSNQVIEVSQYYENNEVTNITQLDNDKLNVIFLYVGQADCTFIKCKDQTMLIDAGNNEDGNNIVNYLKQLGISKIDYLIGTHADEDHIGGIDDVINNMDITNFYIPDVGTDETNYKNAMEAAKIKNITVTNPHVGDIFYISDAKCEVMSAMKYDGVSDNNSSIVFQMNFINNSFLFMGDAEKEVETSRNWNKVDVLKVGHHGSATGTTASFLSQVMPKYAVIEVGKDNKYKLPNSKTIDRINKIGSTILRTDANCTSFLMSCDGNKIESSEVKVNLDGN